MLNAKEYAIQAKMIAKLRKDEIAKKSQARKLQDSGWTTSQWSGMTSEQRLIDNGHYMKSGEKAKLDYLREELRKAKKAQNITKIVRVEK